MPAGLVGAVLGAIGPIADATDDEYRVTAVQLTSLGDAHALHLNGGRVVEMLVEPIGEMPFT